MHAQTALPLALLYAADGRIKGKTRFQKLAFLADQRLQEQDISPFDFIAYDYGPFDKSLFEELELLSEKGLVEISETHTYGGDTRFDYKLTSKGHRNYKKNIDRADSESTLATIDKVAQDIVSEYNDIPISNLIDYVYEEYPEYAENSVLY